jgi:hypothetical protein
MARSWAKVAGFLAVVVILAYFVTVVLRPSIGRVDEGRRLRHPAGFSIVVPWGWTGRVDGYRQTRPVITMIPDRSTGVQPSLVVTKGSEQPEPLKQGPMQPTTFQGRPARVWSGRVQNAHMFYLDVEIEESWYRLSLKLPGFEDVRGGAWWGFLESLQVEPASATTRGAS